MYHPIFKEIRKNPIMLALGIGLTGLALRAGIFEQGAVRIAQASLASVLAIKSFSNYKHSRRQFNVYMNAFERRDVNPEWISTRAVYYCNRQPLLMAAEEHGITYFVQEQIAHTSNLKHTWLPHF